MAAFKNTVNGHVEHVGGGASVGVLFFGALYLVFKGLWAHFFIWMVVVGGFAALTGGPGLLVALPVVGVIYACTIQIILESAYLKKGWVRVEPGAGNSSSSERACPLCAEMIKIAAIRCKHCGAEVEAVAAPELVNGWVAIAWCRDEAEREMVITSIKSEGFPVVNMNGMNVAAGLFHTKDEARQARSVLREKQSLFTAVEYKDSLSTEP